MEGGWGSEHINHQNGGEVDNGQEKGAESGKGRVLLRSELKWSPWGESTRIQLAG